MSSPVEPPAPIRGAIAVAGILDGLLDSEPEALAAHGHFPRDIALIATLGLALPILRRPALRLRCALDYLRLLGASVTAEELALPDRGLYGLLHIGPPMNVILLDEALSDLAAAWVIAHELAHFLNDVCRIRAVWEGRLADRAEAVRRAFAWHEQDDRLGLHAALAGLPARPATALARAGTRLGEIGQRENDADLIARELLAPWAQAAPLVTDLAATGLIRHGTLEPLADELRGRFGLPRAIAQHYAWDLHRVATPYPDLGARLFAPAAR